MKPSWTDTSPAQSAHGKGRHVQIVRDIGMSVLSGECKPGDGLPRETELCATYGVSRPVVREALKMLVAKGLVITRQKVGATVRPREDWHLLDPDVLYWLTQTMDAPKFVDMLLTTREVFEPAAAALAAIVGSDEQLDAVRRAYDAMEAARTADERLEPDLAFHRLIARATNNHLLTYMGNMLSLALRESIRIAHTNPEAMRVSLPRHKAILTALLNRDALAARQATMLQLDSARDDLEEVFTRSKTAPHASDPPCASSTVRCRS